MFSAQTTEQAVGLRFLAPGYSESSEPGLSLRIYIDPGGIYILIKNNLKINYFQNNQIYIDSGGI